MAKIRVNPSSLLQKADEISSVTGGIRKISDGVWSSTSSAPSYDGQFASKVRALGQTAVSRAQKQNNQMTVLSSSLHRRGSAFQSADQASVLGLQTKAKPNTAINTIYLQLLAAFLGLTVSLVTRIFLLGTLTGLSGKFSWSILNTIFGKNHVAKPNSVAPVVTDRAAETTKKITAKNAFGISSLTPANGKDNPYPRKGFQANGYPNSNCTWYTAESVKTLSDGKINLPYWGSATSWLVNAQKYMEGNPDGMVESIDQNPKSGDVVHFNYGHVAMVEKIETAPDGKTYITWSEENADGTVHWTSGSEQIQVDGESILRWRITRPFDAQFIQKYDPHFIHIRY